MYLTNRIKMWKKLTVRVYRYDDGSNWSRKYSDDKRSLPTVKKIYWSEKSNKRTKGKYIIILWPTILVDTMRTTIIGYYFLYTSNNVVKQRVSRVEFNNSESIYQTNIIL